MYFQVTFQYYVFFVPPPSLLGGSPSPGWPIGGLCFPSVVSWPGIVPIVWPGTLSMAWYGTHGLQAGRAHPGLQRDKPPPQTAEHNGLAALPTQLTSNLPKVPPSAT